MDIANDIQRKYDDIFNNLPNGKGNLRFGRRTLSVSSIAKQFYCEKSLEMDYEHPLPPTERMQKGEEGHESITALAKPVSREESIKEALVKREKPLCIYEFGIAWKHESIPIIGHIDEAWFREGNVDLVVERKFSNRLSIYSPYHVQTQLYCLGLGEMGFNNSDTQYKIMVFKRSCYDCPKLAPGTCPIFVDDTADFQCDKGECIRFIYQFDKAKIVKDLNWAIDFWLGRREAIPTKVKAKCIACQHKELCTCCLA